MEKQHQPISQRTAHAKKDVRFFSLAAQTELRTLPTRTTTKSVHLTLIVNGLALINYKMYY